MDMPALDLFEWIAENQSLWPIERKTLRKRASISNLDGTNNKEIGQSNSEYECVL